MRGQGQGWLVVSIVVCWGVGVSHAALFSGGTGEPNDPYQIATVADLLGIGDDPNLLCCHFVLIDDIDLDPNLPGGRVFSEAVIAPYIYNVKPDLCSPGFSGCFNGQGHVIRNLHIRGVSYLGLFGYVSEYAEVCNVSLEAVDVNGTGGGIGGLAGWNGGEISTSYCEGTVLGFGATGGLVGRSEGSIVASYSHCWVASNYYAGGLVGNNQGSMLECYSLGTTRSEQCTGGLVGLNSQGIIRSCYSTGWVYGEVEVGGLVGASVDGRVVSCYSWAQASGFSHIGGLMGTTTGVIESCYSIGVVQGNRFGGGLVADSSDAVKQCCWDIESSGHSGSAGGVGLTTLEMMDPEMLGLNGWAEDPNWILNPGQDYPRLVWEQTDGQAIAEPNVDWLEGDGSQEEPYQIATAAQLERLSKAGGLMDGHFVLMNSLDINEYTWGQAVIPFFNGTFDGGGHLIRHLTIQGNGHVGLFGMLYTEAQVCNLGLEAVDVNGLYSGVGSLAGHNKGSVTACFGKGEVAGKYATGGLIGRNEGSLVSCCFKGWVKGQGGLVGYNIYGRIVACYSHTAPCRSTPIPGVKTRQVHFLPICSEASSCGLVGDSFMASISLCFSVGGGGLVGWEEDSTTTLSFWDREVARSTQSDGGIGLTTAEMQDINTYLDAGWDFVGETANGTRDYWIIEPGQYPELAVFAGEIPHEPNGLGTVDDPYEVCDAYDLGGIWYRPQAHYRQVGDIDLNDITWSTAVVPRLSGTFDGDQRTIHRLHIQGGDYLGLIGQTSPGALVSNVALNLVDVNGTEGTIGGLVGCNDTTRITNCHVNGRVQGRRGWSVGGLVGTNQQGELLACSSSSSVVGNYRVGGLTGVNDEGTIHGCLSSGPVSAYDYVGGLLGENHQGWVTSCYSTSSVESQSDDHTGGLVGIFYQGLVRNCYSASPIVTGRGLIGGYYYGDDSHWQSSFWDTEVSGILESNGGIGLPTTQMQDINTFLDAGWDFVDETDNGTEDIWWMPEGDCPRLWWERLEGD